MFDRPDIGECAIIVSIKINHFKEQASLDEFIELARSADAIVKGTIVGTRDMPHNNTFIGTGKLEEIKLLIDIHKAEIVLFNHVLTPGQERNLEEALQCRVIDRIGLILDIFAKRARSFEGKLQVELAQLKHLSTRLIRGWTHLERQKGGIGLRGPGETQLETDRRLISNRIKYINRRLDKVDQQRQLSRKARERNALPVVSIVGYTNAGKSTLFNCLTQANIFAADKLFATLDTTLRRVVLPNKTVFVLADTVGFIQQLPHDLVVAFRSTLEETRTASLLLHIVDASDEERQLRVQQVNQVLKEIGADKIPQILVYNKIDDLECCQAHCEQDLEQIDKVWLSAKTGEGINLLYELLSKELTQESMQCWVRIPVNAGDLRARLFNETTILQEQYADNGDSLIEMQLPKKYFNQLAQSDARLQLINR